MAKKKPPAPPPVRLDIPCKIFQEPYKSDISTSAKWLYISLLEVERRRPNDGRDYFYITNAELADVAGMSLSAVKRAKSELEAVTLIKPCKVHFIESGAGTPQKKLSKHYVSGYRIRRDGG